MLNKNQKFQISGIYGQAEGRFRKILEFWSMTVFRGLDLTTHCNAQKKQLFAALKLTKHCHAQKFQNLRNLPPAWPQMSEFWNIRNFMSITVFREFQGWKFRNCLSITVFRGLNLTKHCNAQKQSTFHSLKAHKT